MSRQPKLPAPWKGLGLEIDDDVEIKWADPDVIWPRCVTILFTWTDGTPFVQPNPNVEPFPLGDDDMILKIQKAR